MSKPLLNLWPAGKRVLLAVAAPREAQAVLAGLSNDDHGPLPEWRSIPANDRFEIVLTGVGKANAAGAVARVCDPSRHNAVLSVGVAGALPGSNVPIGSVVLASSSAYGDEGVITPDGFLSLDEMGFPPIPRSGVAIEGNVELIAALRPTADQVGVIATVSTCSGTHAQAVAVQHRTGALAEAMEGAAVGCAVERINNERTATSIVFSELRVISNTTGERENQHWDLASALNRLTSVVKSL